MVISVEKLIDICKQKHFSSVWGLQLAFDGDQIDHTEILKYSLFPCDK